jgi:hypothetical protein
MPRDDSSNGELMARLVDCLVRAERAGFFDEMARRNLSRGESFAAAETLRDVADRLERVWSKIIA